MPTLVDPLAACLSADLSSLPTLRELAEASDQVKRAYANWAIARVSESPRTAWTWHTDPLAGDDRADGGPRQPLRSLAAAVALARAGDTVVLASGIYRETLAPIHGGTAERPLAFVADGVAPVITAADPWTPVWRDEGDGQWSTPWTALAWDEPRAWETPSAETPANRCEQVWGDGALFIHTADRERLLLLGCGREALQLMPDQSRCSGNASDDNLLWADGSEPLCRLEDGDNRLRPMDQWALCSGHDRHSQALPPDWLGLPLNPDGLRDRLRRAWLARGLADTGLCDGVAPLPVRQWLALLCPGREGWVPLECVQTGPSCGVQLWRAPQGQRYGLRVRPAARRCGGREAGRTWRKDR